MIILLIGTIMMNLLIQGTISIDTEDQKKARDHTLWAVGIVGWVILGILGLWTIGRCCFLKHSHDVASVAPENQ